MAVWGNRRPPLITVRTPSEPVARQLLGAMRALGHERFAVVGHDRGSYYALRMALDHPGHVARAALLDCLPISEHLDRTDARFATAWWHWFFFAQPKLPERVIIANPDAWYRGDPEVMGPENYAEWRAAVHDPDVIRGMLEDYRAGLGIDAEHERADRAAGRRVQQPLLVLWSTKDDLEELYGDPLQIWRGWADNVTGHGIVSGHHVAEQAPDELAEALGSFLTAGAPCPDPPEASPGSVRELLLRFFQAENGGTGTPMVRVWRWTWSGCATERRSVLWCVGVRRTWRPCRAPTPAGNPPSTSIAWSWTRSRGLPMPSWLSTVDAPWTHSKSQTASSHVSRHCPFNFARSMALRYVRQCSTIPREFNHLSQRSSR